MNSVAKVPSMGTLVLDARALLPVNPTINQIMDAGCKVMDAHGLTTNAGTLANIAEGLIALFGWESKTSSELHLQLGR